MNKGVRIGLVTAKASCQIIAVVVSLLAGRAFDANAQTETNLFSFVNLTDNGSYTGAGLAQGRDGNFYGTTDYGGTSTNCGIGVGCGTVFRISPSGIYTTLHSFAGYPTDGGTPIGKGLLVQGTDGNFYGTTRYGGTSANCGVGVGCGTVFRISPSGTYTTLHSFAGYPTDGGTPFAGLVQGSDGTFYGTTYGGGANGLGSVFRISPSGTHTTLYSFGNSPDDGDTSFSWLVQGSDGNLYGTTDDGGTNGLGTVFRISPSGTYTTLYSFGNSPADGSDVQAGLVQGSDGNFYGVAGGGGTNSCDCGAVFRISPSGTYTTLYSFGSSPTDGVNAWAGIVQGSDGNFYGVADSGGTSTNCGVGVGCGTLFRISPSGTYATLYSFGSSSTDGQTPRGLLVQGSDGSFYGTTAYGGTNNIGTVFRSSVPLNPPPYPINQITEVQLSGTNVVLRIPSIAGETYQLQISSSMTPTNWVNVSGVSVTNSIGALLTLTNFGGALQSQRFYRFDITP